MIDAVVIRDEIWDIILMKCHRKDFDGIAVGNYGTNIKVLAIGFHENDISDLITNRNVIGHLLIPER
jgi:hypothetical protein